MKRRASAQWRGGLKNGSGRVSTESGALAEKPYGFSARFENEAGTNPEELIAAAHASCFAMALSGQLETAQMAAESIDVKADVSLDKRAEGWTVTAIHLDVAAKIPGAASREAFLEAADRAKTGCPMSRLLGAAASVTMDARLN